MSKSHRTFSFSLCFGMDDEEWQDKGGENPVESPVFGSSYTTGDRDEYGGNWMYAKDLFEAWQDFISTYRDEDPEYLWWWENRFKADMRRLGNDEEFVREWKLTPETWSNAFLIIDEVIYDEDGNEIDRNEYEFGEIGDRSDAVFKRHFDFDTQSGHWVEKS